MISIRSRLMVPALLVALAGCAAYDPPVRGDHTADKYKTDLEACRTSSREAIRLRNADTLTTWLISPVTGPPEVRAAIRACMEKDGYVLENPG
jgi:hypothetical protein